MNEKTKGSRLPGFYNLSLQERRKIIQETGLLSDEEIGALIGETGLSAEQADHMVENVIGTYALPLGLGLNFLVNGREVLVPMVIEEPSVVAGASFMAKLAREGGGFSASTTAPEMIGQMQVIDLDKDVVASTREVPGSNAFVTKDWVGRLLFNCILYGERVVRTPEQIRRLRSDPAAKPVP